MEMIEVRNGVSANPRRRKKRNPVSRSASATKTANPRRRKRRNPVRAANPPARAANPRRRRRRNPSTTTAIAANPRRRRRRNPTVAVANKRRRGRRRNGIFGDTKSEVKQVASIIGGLVGTKIIGGIVSPYVNNILAGIGAGKFITPIVDGALAFTVVPMAAKWVGGDPKLARLGALSLVGLDLLQMFLPSGFAYSPFNNNASPIILGNGGQLAAAAAADVANAAINAANDAAAKVGGGNFTASSMGYPQAAEFSEMGGEF